MELFGVANRSDTPFDEWLPTQSYVPVPLAAVIYEQLTGRPISTGTLYRLIRRGKLNAIRPNGGEMLIRVCDISLARVALRTLVRMVRGRRAI